MFLFFSNKDSDHHLQSDSNADYTSSGVYEEDLSHSGGRGNSNGEGHAHGRIHQSPDTHESSSSHNSDWTKDLDTPPIPVATQGGGGGGGASVIFKVSYLMYSGCFCMILSNKYERSSSHNSDWTKDLDTPPIPIATQGGGGRGGLCHFQGKLFSVWQ